jgi:hypothetical protein
LWQPLLPVGAFPSPPLWSSTRRLWSAKLAATTAGGRRADRVAAVGREIAMAGKGNQRHLAVVHRLCLLTGPGRGDPSVARLVDDGHGPEVAPSWATAITLAARRARTTSSSTASMATQPSGPQPWRPAVRLGTRERSRSRPARSANVPLTLWPARRWTAPPSRRCPWVAPYRCPIRRSCRRRCTPAPKLRARATPRCHATARGPGSNSMAPVCRAGRSFAGRPDDGVTLAEPKLVAVEDDNDADVVG